jgi:hypothetical protein
MTFRQNGFSNSGSRLLKMKLENSNVPDFSGVEDKDSSLH